MAHWVNRWATFTKELNMPWICNKDGLKVGDKVLRVGDPFPQERVTRSLLSMNWVYGSPDPVTPSESPPEPVVVSTPEPESVTQELPEDFPARDLLLAAGLTTMEAVAAASDKDLLDLEGLGEATLKKVRKALV